MNKNSLLVLLCLCLIFFSCDDRVVYNQFQTIEKGLWEKEKELVFTFEIEDINIPYNLVLELRNNNLYPFQNLWLTYKEEYPDSVSLSRQDTLSITLADEYGNWSGTGISLFETEYPIYSNIYFENPGVYTYTFKHLMYKDPLPGLQDIGIRLERNLTSPFLKHPAEEK